MSVPHPIGSVASGLLGILEATQAISRCMFVEYSMWQRKKIDLVNRRTYNIPIMSLFVIYLIFQEWSSYSMCTTWFHFQQWILSHWDIGQVGYNFLSALRGHKLCKTSWLRYLGIGKSRLLRTGKRFRGIDERTINQGSMELMPLKSGCVSVRMEFTVSHGYPGCSSIGKGATTRPANQTASANTFFCHLYWTAGECMPTK